MRGLTALLIYVMALVAFWITLSNYALWSRPELSTTDRWLARLVAASLSLWLGGQFLS